LSAPRGHLKSPNYLVLVNGTLAITVHDYYSKRY